jgi:hypothetical protein
LYSREYGWDSTFEGLVAEIAGRFLTHFDAARERCWIAEIDGDRVGCVFLVKQTVAVASSAYCWWRRRRVGSRSARGWSTNVSRLPGRQVIAS